MDMKHWGFGSQISWVEETGTVVSINFDLPNKRIFTFMTFSQGHCECRPSSFKPLQYSIQAVVK